MENSEKGEPNIRVIAAVIGLGMLLFAADATGIIGQGFEYDDYGAVLEAYVDDRGMVNYDELKADREKLDAFATTIATLDPKVYDQWTENQKVAFWINAYNALTLQAIINHYPIKPSFFASIRFPKNSIRQIPGVWDELQFAAMGRKMTLDEIEHETLRKNFNEPRIHMALVCAAMGCPPLRNEPFAGDRLDAQLDDQTRRFLENPQKFRIDPVNGRVYLSPIFKWFGKDFIKTYGTGEKFSGKSETERAVLKFISGHIDESVAKYLATGEYDLEYLDYDWSLNEQKGK
jgi:hypothetical protein